MPRPFLSIANFLHKHSFLGSSYANIFIWFRLLFLLLVSYLAFIYRVVTELHKPETKRKKEWQEKLPTVVLRAEEILYSKAKSEADYMDVKTLRERLEDAVDTMIRRTDASKEDPYMEPCVEAALYLGCYRKSFPRGQRGGARHASGNAKRVSSSFSGASSGSSTGASPSLNNHSSFRVPELPIPGSMHPSLGLLRLNYCPDPRSSFLYTTRHNPAPIYRGFALSNQEANKIESPAPAKGIQETETIPSLPIPNAAELSARYPLCLSSHTTSEQTSMPLNDKPNTTSHHESQFFRPAVGSLKTFSDSLHLKTPIFADMARQTEAPVALLVDDYSRSAALTSHCSSPVSNFASLVSCKSKIHPSVLSQVSSSIHCDSAESVLKDLWNETKETLKMKRIDSPAEQSTAASPIAEFDDLQLRLAPPGNLLPPSGISQGMTSSMSCVTHPPAQPAEEVRRFIGGSSDISQNATNSFSLSPVPKMIVGSASSEMTPDCQLPNIYLNQQSISSNADNMQFGFQGGMNHMTKETSPANKRQRLSSETFSFSVNAGDSGCSEQSCDLQIGLNLQVQR